MSERSGLVALGDSITYGEGGIVLGVDGRSWALWLAQALDEPYVNYAVCGARVADVLRDQLPRVRRPYAIGVLYAGVNDVRDPGFDADAFARDLQRAAEGLAARCGRLLLLSIPRDLGRPRAGVRVVTANAAIRATAAGVGATVVALDDLAGRRHVLPDAVHPTALGQLEIADRAARALQAPELPSRRTPPQAGRAAVARVALDWRRQWLREAWRRARAAGDVRRRTPPGVERAVGARVGRGVVLAAAEGGRIVLGPDAVIGDRCRLRAEAGALIAVDGVLDERCRLEARVSIIVEVGARVGPECVLTDVSPVFDDAERPIREQGVRAAPVRVGAGALLGPRVAVLPGVTVGAGASVLANSVCADDAPAGASVAGAPARAPNATRPPAA